MYSGGPRQKKTAGHHLKDRCQLWLMVEVATRWAVAAKSPQAQAPKQQVTKNMLDKNLSHISGRRIIADVIPNSVNKDMKPVAIVAMPTRP